MLGFAVRHARSPRRACMCSMMSDWKVELADESNVSEFYVEFHGPKDSEWLFKCAGKGQVPDATSPLMQHSNAASQPRNCRPRHVVKQACQPCTQAHTRVECGRCTWSCQRLTPTNRRPSALSTGSSTPT